MYINSEDNLRFSNVVSKKVNFHYKNMEEEINNFLMSISDKNLKAKGPFYYSINSLPMSENVEGEFFMPIYEDHIYDLYDLEFHSYYSIENMISTCIYEDIEENTELAYYNLLTYINENNLFQITPIFHIVSGDSSMQYVFIKIGVVERESEKGAF
ncbi:DUF5085 family protein [Clostridium sp. SHJSY1]|uniref:DUF5085 family protein n=1 Tax=Clostridium sp. SHJSY1 TaxID=2942483 RepID=UPI0028755B58|nr:DUF5085 family protein [Clostridium sp. SHJSY1]MDS0525609.1 DUF5085 family protein [Clostridium sp. SHJSY1]